MLLSNKVAIITGASRGLGRTIALTFAKEGAHLILNGTKINFITEVIEEVRKYSKKSLFVLGDISKPETSKLLVTKAIDNFKRVDILVNNAGIITRTPSEKMSPKEWNRVLNVNLTGTLNCCLAVLPHMKAQKNGKIVNISSIAAKEAHNSSPSYGASKAGILYLTKHFAKEMGPYGIYINAVCPGPMETDMAKQWSEDYRRQLSSKTVLGRIGKPEEIAHTVLFLASKMSDYITGQSINVDGGIFMQ